MKKNRKLKNLMLFASSGAIVCSGSAAFANDSGTYRVEEKVEVRTESNLNESAGAERPFHRSSAAPLASFGKVHRASDLIGMEVRNHRNENLGEIRDVMVDLNSGRIPFAILSSDVGNRLVALPPSALTMSGENRVMLDMDKEHLRSAPSFERNLWPDMSNQQWSSDVYRFYGVDPYQQTSYRGMQPYQRREVYTKSTITEPSGSPYYHSQSREGTLYPDLGEVQGITRLDDISGNRSRGGAVDLQRFAHRNEGPVGGTAQWQHSTTMAQPRSETRHHVRRYDDSTRVSKVSHYHRASELIGMNVRNSQGQTVGEIQDIILDMNSGNVAYAVIDANPYLNTRNEFVAVPPSLLRTGTDARMVTLNADRNVLMNAPRFENTKWSQASNERFVSRVYSHYGQQPYWQAQGFRQGTQYREPSGAELNQNYQHQDQQQFRNERQYQQIQPSQQSPSLPSEDRSYSFQQEQKFSDPAGAELQSEEPERSVSDAAEAHSQAKSESSATLETKESQASAPSAGFQGPTEQGYLSEITVESASAQLQEPSGAELEPQVSVHAEKQGAKIDEPAGAEPSQEYPVPTRTRPGVEVSEPAGADVTNQSEQSATGKESADTDANAQQVQEAAGAATGSTQTQKLTQQVQTALKSDPSLQAQTITVTTEDGKIVLRGSVKSETQKQQIEQRVQDVLLENQIQVQGTQPQGGDTQSQP